MTVPAAAAWLLVALLVLAAATAAVLAARWHRASAELARARERIAVLEADLDTALRPPPASTTTERAVRRVIRTASRVRDQGIGGLIQSSLDELQAWAREEQRDIVSMAAADGTVTLFFSDIEDSTALNSRLGDDAWVRLLAAHDAVVRARVDKYRGQVVKSAGDGFMVVFRDAEAACRAALGIQRDHERPSGGALRRDGVRVRIGVHTGPVVSRDGDYFGANVALAARVADLAVGGEVLASDQTRTALDDDAAVVAVDARDVELKGLPGPHRVWRIERRARRSDQAPDRALDRASDRSD